MTVTVTPTVELSNVPPRIRLNVTASAGETSTTVLRNDPDGVQRPVRTNDGGPLTLSAGAGLLYDYEPPYAAPVSFTSQESLATVSAEVTVGETRVWLIHPGVPELSIPITVAEISERQRRVQRGVFYPMGRKYPVIQTDGQRKAPEYTLSIYTDDLDERYAIEALLEDAGVLLLNVPASKGWGVGAEYVSIGDTTEARYARYLGYADRRWDLPLVVVDPPAGGTQAERTLATIAADYSSLSAVSAAYPTLLALAAGP